MAQVPESLWESQADPPAQAPIEYELVINLNIAAGAAPTYRRRCSSGTDGMIEIERLFAAVPESASGAFATGNDDVRKSVRGGDPDMERTSPKDRV